MVFRDLDLRSTFHPDEDRRSPGGTEKETTPKRYKSGTKEGTVEVKRDKERMNKREGNSQWRQ